MPSASCLKKTHFLSGMLLFGTLTAITMKMQLVMTCVGYGNVLHTFDKPFFQSIAMFVSMALALPINQVGNCIRRARSPHPEVAPLLADSPAIQQKEGESGKAKKKSKPYIIAVPAMFDLVASTIMTYGLIFLSTSVFQMLRGSMVIFSAILTRIFLPGRRLKGYHMLGIVLCFIALCMVGAAGILQPQPNQVVSVSQTLLGIGLVLVSQCIQAGQLVTEEFLLKDLDMSPLNVVGFEGIWGTLAMVFIACPFAYFVPGYDYSTMPHNSLENTLDSFICLARSPMLILAVVLFCGAVLFYNIYGMLITDSFSAINRTIFEAVRTSCIWVVNLVIHAISPNSPYGEIWSKWSFLELAGFLVLVASSLVYNDVIRIPGFAYPQTQKKPDEQPTTTHTPADTVAVTPQQQQ